MRKEGKMLGILSRVGRLCVCESEKSLCYLSNKKTHKTCDNSNASYIFAFVMTNQIYNKEENAEAYLAWRCVNETYVNIFLTGKAGTGKTTFLKNLRSHCNKRIVVVAPTGVAAINAGGVTIHSFFQLPFSPYIPGAKMNSDYAMRKEKIRIIRTLDLLVIDEISMVRADLLDALDTVLRQYRRSSLPFGGVQLLMIGDLQQLSPVVTDDIRDIIYSNYDTPYFFSSKALSRTVYATVELKKIYRQKDEGFVEILNKVRNNNVDAATLEALNSRYIEDFNPSDEEGYIRLSTHNNKADAVNNIKLDALKGKTVTYTSSVEGTFPETSFPADKELRLKVGAQVMFLKNDVQAVKRYYNGKIGRVVGLTDEVVRVECDGQEIEVSAEKWSNTKYVLNKETNEINEVEEGSFTQIPLRLAWAITIHKSQGLTFDKAIIDAQMSFSHGQVYVALSRCRTLEGMVLGSRLSYGSFVNDRSVAAFIDDQRTREVTETKVDTMKMDYLATLLKELFTFTSITSECYKLIRVLEEHLHKSYPKLIETLQDKMIFVESDVVAVGERFCQVMDSKRRQEIDLSADDEFMERVTKGSKYYVGKLLTYIGSFVDETNISIDNKDVKKRFDNYREALENEYLVKKMLFEHVGKDGFTVEGYLKLRSDVILKVETTATRYIDIQKAESKEKEKNNAEVEHPGLLKLIKKWRRDYAVENDIETEYMILNQRTMHAICNELPTTIDELKAVKGVGQKKVKAFGEEIVEIVKEYCKNSKTK
jgi:uncharacterized membrane-anchored protein YhcB (DUF1043 family)